MPPNGSEILGVLRGIQIVAEVTVREQSKLYKHLWRNSSAREILEQNSNEFAEYLQNISNNPQEGLSKLQSFVRECRERTCAVSTGLRQLFMAKSQNRQTTIEQMQSEEVAFKSTVPKESNIGKTLNATNVDAINLDISSITLKEFEEILAKRHKNKKISLKTDITKSEQISEVNSPKIVQSQPNILKEAQYKKNIDSVPISDIELPALEDVAKQRRVPSSRLGRLASFGGLFAGLGIGTINELTKGALGLGGAKTMKDALLSPANAERIVDTLCKVRGAALKIGQILSIQDSNVVSPELAKAFERVRQAADYMPDWQVERVMVQQLGTNWRDLLREFDEKPFAAASIGQVHCAILKTGMPVAMKIQYPGVAQSIESDIDNLVGMLKLWDIFPHGFFIDNVVRVAKRELRWEVDYLREAEYTENFKKMISPYPEYYVPLVIKELTTECVLTTEFVPGKPLDKCFNLSYDHRHYIGQSVLKLCLRELFELQCMQTDPNWSNFLYDAKASRLMLIDFGSTRFYDKHFINNYRNIIINAINNDRQGVLNGSRTMGFLTGYETKQMEQAHVNAVMILGEIFRHEGEYDFGQQNITERIANLVPTLMEHRLCPPPEEIYSIHRKLSGIFLLCARLKIKLKCRPHFEEIVLNKFLP